MPVYTLSLPGVDKYSESKLSLLKENTYLDPQKHRTVKGGILEENAELNKQESRF